MQVQPYLSFEGRCDEAIEFYKKALGAKVDMLMRFKEAPDQSMVTPQSKDKVMHAAVHVGDTQILMSDGRCQGGANFNGIALALSAPTDADAERMFNALADGGKVNMPMAKTFFFFPLRHVFRQVWRRLDGARRALRSSRPAPTSPSMRRAIICSKVS